MYKTYEGKIYEWAFNNFDEWFYDYIKDKPYHDWALCIKIDDLIKHELTIHSEWKRRFYAVWKLVKSMKENATELENIVISPIHLRLSYLKERCERRQ